MSTIKICEVCGAIDKQTFSTQNCPECNSPNFILDYDEALRGMETPPIEKSIDEDKTEDYCEWT